MMAAVDDILPVVSGLLWTAVYVQVIRVSRQDNTYAMPLVAICLNLAWELVYFSGGVVYWGKYDSDTRVQTVINGGWFLLDIAIFILLCRYLRREYPQLSAAVGRALLAGCLLCSVAFQLALLVAVDAEDAARLSAFLQNAFMSGAFIGLYIARGARGQRVSIAILKLLGTAAPTVSAGVLGGFVPSLFVLGVLCVILDSIYLILIATAQGAGRERQPLASIDAKSIRGGAVDKYRRADSQ